MYSLAILMLILVVFAVLFLRRGYLFKLFGYTLLFLAGVAPILPVMSRLEVSEATSFDVLLLITGLAMIALCLVKGSQGFAQVGRDLNREYNPE